MSPQNMIGKWALHKGEFRGGLLRIAATGVKSGAPKGLGSGRSLLLLQHEYSIPEIV